MQMIQECKYEILPSGVSFSVSSSLNWSLLQNGFFRNARLADPAWYGQCQVIRNAAHLLHIIQNIIKPYWDAQTHISPTLRWLTSISSFPFLLYPHRIFPLSSHTLIWNWAHQLFPNWPCILKSICHTFKLSSHTLIWSWAHHPITNWSQGHDSLLANKQIYTKVKWAKGSES